MKRPLLLGLCFFISGILAGQYATTPVGIALFFASAIFSCIWLYIKYRYKPVFLFLFASAIGSIVLVNAQRPTCPDINILAQSGKTMIMRGVVMETAETASGGQRILLATEQIESQGLIYSTGFKIQCYFDTGQELEPGMRLTVSGNLLLPSPARNPGGFDEYFYLRARGIEYKSYCVLIEINGRKDSLASILDRVRHRLGNVYNAVLPATEAGIARSIILGDKSSLDPDIKELYRAGGIYHILAISGLHISTLIMILNFICKKLFSPRISGGVLLFLIVLYCILTGGSPSTIRAVIMAGVVIAGTGTPFYRKSDLCTSTAFACGCILIYNPFYLWDIGFLYSFAAVFSISILTPPVERLFVLLGTRQRFAGIILNSSPVRNYLAPSLAIFIGCLPLVSRTFYYLPIYSIFVNLLVLPTVFLLVLTGLLVGITGLIFLPAASFFAGSLYYLLKIYQVICQFTSGLPFSQILTGYMPTAAMALYYATIGCFCVCLISFDENFIKYRKLGSIMAACFVLFMGIKTFAPTPLVVTMLDIGQGDCFVLTKNHVTVVIDGGGWRNATPGSNTGARVLSPYLDYLAVGKVDAVFLTHTDSDHSAGIIELLDIKPTEIVFLPDIDYSGDLVYDEIAKISKKNGVKMELLEAGYVISMGGGFSITCLSPQSDIIGSDSNDNSLVLLVQSDDNSILFTGDISENKERQLLESGALVHADILKLAHHGSSGSNSSSFLQAVAPNVTIVSTGANNTYGHPSDTVLQRLEGMGVDVWNTAECGAVIIEANRGILQMRAMIR